MCFIWADMLVVSFRSVTSVYNHRTLDDVVILLAINTSLIFRAILADVGQRLAVLTCSLRVIGHDLSQCEM